MAERRDPVKRAIRTAKWLKDNPEVLVDAARGMFDEIVGAVHQLAGRGLGGSESEGHAARSQDSGDRRQGAEVVACKAHGQRPVGPRC